MGCGASKDAPQQTTRGAAPVPVVTAATKPGLEASKPTPFAAAPPAAPMAREEQPPAEEPRQAAAAANLALKVDTKPRAAPEPTPVPAAPAEQHDVAEPEEPAPAPVAPTKQHDVAEPAEPTTAIEATAATKPTAATEPPAAAEPPAATEPARQKPGVAPLATLASAMAGALATDTSERGASAPADDGEVDAGAPHGE
ncbi:hypothetical protein KFE25_010483 [Diacronema lutheri]|uniref:Uncharacterized protein n=1 Tax=Diacronema lutheri TaxID=2081491 RepID=A0A8J5X9F6_DIALT|nr:hypothetical protein KFE25_010483 [Diacronema lutheri]